MPEQHMNDDKFFNVRGAKNIVAKRFLFITNSISEQLNNDGDEPLRLFITDNAGTGKNSSSTF